MVGLYGGKFGVCGLLRRDAGFYCGQYEGLLRVIRGSIGFYCGLMGGVSRNRPEVNSNHARIEWSTNRRVTPIPIGEDPRMTRALEGRFLTG